MHVYVPVLYCTLSSRLVVAYSLAPAAEHRTHTGTDDRRQTPDARRRRRRRHAKLQRQSTHPPTPTQTHSSGAGTTEGRWWWGWGGHGSGPVPRPPFHLPVPLSETASPPSPANRQPSLFFSPGLETRHRRDTELGTWCRTTIVACSSHRDIAETGHHATATRRPRLPLTRIRTP